MTKYGCNNRQPLKQTAFVQSGWVDKYTIMPLVETRIALMTEIPDPLSKTCQYQKQKKDDPKCIGCKELEL